MKDGNQAKSINSDKEIQGLPVTQQAAEVVRPLLGFRRQELREYLRASHETWCEDTSNSDETFLRNRIRHQLLPQIATEFGDAAIQHMAELAEIARAEEEYWSERNTKDDPSATVLDLKSLLARPLAVQRRQIRA